MKDFIPLPKRNIWKILWDIRPAGMTQEDLLRSVMPFVDLRVFVRRATRLISLEKEEPEFEERERKAVFALDRRIWIMLGMILFLGALFGAGNYGRIYLESRKAELFKVGTEARDRAELAMEHMRQMRFRDAKREFQVAAAELNRLEAAIAPALFATSLSAKILPQNDYVKTAFMLSDIKTLMSTAANFNDVTDQLITKAPHAIFHGDSKFAQLLAAAGSDLKTLSFLITKIENNRNPFADSLAGNWFNRLPENKLLLEEAAQSLDLLERVLGPQRKVSVLLLFQNPAEIRATGGFVGSYAVARLENGMLREFQVDDIYNPDGQLNEFVLPPRPLRRITPVWEARDANWFFDFGLSAKKTMTFIEKATGRTFDIVVAVNPNVVAELIDLVGPIEMPEYKKIIHGSNFWEEAQFQTRAGPDRKINQPKRFLTILGPRLLEKMQQIDARNFPKLMDIFSRGLGKKDILLWAKDPKLQAFIEERNWGGRVRDITPNEDYLAIVLSNIGGAKADYVMSQNYQLQTTIEPSGAIVNTLRIIRNHAGDRAKYPWWKARNFTYIRVLVPRGSILLSASGTNQEPPLLEVEEPDHYSFDPDIMMSIEAAVHLDAERVDIFEESGRTAFGFWHVIDPGQSKTITLRWQLPFKAGFAPPHYVLHFQKQSGVEGIFQHTIELPRGSTVQSVEPASQTVGRSTLGDRFSWIGEEIAHDIRHAISYQLR